jgi:sigma-E factor negative regulatory protein RseB
MRPAVFTLLLLFGATLARAEGGDPSEWLGRLSRSASELSYRGVLVFERGDHTETLRFSHLRDNGREYERLEYLDGAPREIIRSGSQLTCIHPGQRLERLFQKKQLLKEGLAGLERFYHLRSGGDDRVAGRAVEIIEILPRDGHRLGHRLAVDRDTGLLLRSELLGSGRVLERFQFVTLDIGAEPGATWTGVATDVGVQPVAAEPAETAAGAPPWSPQWLPPGFELAIPAEKSEVQTYSDGLAMVSIFMAPADPERSTAEDGQAQQGATVAHTRPVRFQQRGFLVTVVGEVPAATAQRIAAAVAWR